MGRKIHPLGFRLGVNQEHYSHWFARSKDYFKLLEEDKKIRGCIENYMEKHIKSPSNHGGVGRINIQRKTDLIQIEIYTGFPDLFIEEQSLGVDQLKIDIGKLLSSDSQRIRVTLKSIDQPYGEPKILAEFIASQLKNRVAFRRTMKKAIELVGGTSNKGVKIQIAGRLNGSEMARTEWTREGRVPLQTLRACIDYCYYPAQTIYGVLGIKVRIFRDAR
uniref:ribosomal protein S3 n=1 Tax=Lygodium flexuosum TaxID=85330 RepID=UPI002A8075F4|nr:ribosomal protein S3 [Lygodium flexuosum]UYS92499.1 ribosomal protein S3 [Lygodium flexuosum]